MNNREKFEEWAAYYMLAGVTRRGDGEYIERETSDLWQAWQAACQWRPIEEAPKDGETLLVWCPDTEEIVTAWWEESYGRWVWLLMEEVYECCPTHFQRLPPPPNGESR